MNIERVNWLPFSLPYAATFATAHGSARAREGVLLRLTTTEGLIGLGEASPVPGFGGGTLADIIDVIAGFAARLVGSNLMAADVLLAELDSALPGVSAAACALDTALYDLRAQAADVPVAALLGAYVRSVPVNATIGAPMAEAAAEAARRAAEAGFSCVKLKVGMADTVAAELLRIAAVRAALGLGVGLRLDANGSWDTQTAIAIIRAAEPYQLELVEQPVPAADLSGMARVRAAVATPIAADEAVAGPEQARHVIAANAADVLVVKPMLTGGLRRAREVVAMAQATNLRALVTSTIDSGVGVAAALHLAATLPVSFAYGLATGPLLAADLLTTSLVVRGGAMLLPDAPGLGVTLDERQLAQYGVAWRDE